MRRRPAAVAGTFYPGANDELAAQIDAFLADAAVGPPPKALIAPHAGTIYSGPIAASAYARVAAARERIRRVVLLGPAHRVWLEGLGASSAEAFSTPLGDVPLARDAIDGLLALPQVRVHDEAHRREHSLELHLPFLQRVLGEFDLVPLVVGQASPEDVAEVIDTLWGGDETLVVISSDLSHYLDYASARALDRETSDLIEKLAYEALTGERACGFHPVRGLLCSARKRGLSARTIDLRNSGETAGSRTEVVGYGSYVLD